MTSSHLGDKPCNSIITVKHDGTNRERIFEMSNPAYPSFRACFNRSPIPGIDYDPDNLSQDDYEYFTGTGQYSDAIIPYDEQEYLSHLSSEGSNAWNDNPDGCYFCGGDHHSDCCPERY